MLTYPKHEDGQIDGRYSVNLEYCGYSYPLHIVRFCDEKIGACQDEYRASHVMMKHWDDRQSILKG